MSSTSVNDLLFAFDFDAACLMVGLDAEKRIRESKAQGSNVRTIKRVMGR